MYTGFFLTDWLNRTEGGTADSKKKSKTISAGHTKIHYSTVKFVLPCLAARLKVAGGGGQPILGTEDNIASCARFFYCDIPHYLLVGWNRES